MATNEAAVLRDFCDKIDYWDNIVSAHPQLADDSFVRSGDKLRQVRFIGRTELAIAAPAIAAYWTERVEETGGLLVGFSPDESSIQIYDAVASQLAQSSPNTLQALTPVDISDPKEGISAGAFRALSRHGMVIIDDWAITGHRMHETVGRLAPQIGYASLLEINLVSAAPQHLAAGIGNTPVKAHYVHPDRAPDDEPSTPAITGAHSSVDIGFRDIIEGTADTLREAITGNERLEYPLLHMVAKQHGTEYTSNDPFFRARREHLRSIADQATPLSRLR